MGWVKAGNGWTFRHRITGVEYTEIHFGIMLLKPGKLVSHGRYTTSGYIIIDGLVGECNPAPAIKWRIGLDGLSWVGNILPDEDYLISTDGGNP